jgi:hypothetical protein
VSQLNPLSRLVSSGLSGFSWLTQTETGQGEPTDLQGDRAHVRTNSVAAELLQSRVRPGERAVKTLSG